VYCDATRWPTVAGFAVPAGARPKPYADIYALGSTGSQRDVFETQPSTFTTREPRTFGLDANIPLTSTLAFVGTLAPDFSNVEADQTTIAPQEFPIRYTEYRPFFAQGSQYIDAIPTFNVNRYKYDAFYSPSIGVLDTGYKLEGTVGSHAIGEPGGIARVFERKDRNRRLFGNRQRRCLWRFAGTVVGPRHGRTDPAIASTRQRLDPGSPVVLIQHAAERGDLHCEIAVLDGKSRPSRLDQGVLGDGRCSAVQKQAQQCDSALAKQCGLDAAQQHAGLDIERKRAEFVDR